MKPRHVTFAYHRQPASDAYTSGMSSSQTVVIRHDHCAEAGSACSGRERPAYVEGPGNGRLFRQEEIVETYAQAFDAARTQA